MCDLRLTLERGESADLTTPLHRRDRQASLARSFDLADRRVDLELAWFVGIDWGSQKHQACVPRRCVPTRTVFDVWSRLTRQLWSCASGRV